MVRVDTVVYVRQTTFRFRKECVMQVSVVIKIKCKTSMNEIKIENKWKGVTDS